MKSKLFISLALVGMIFCTSCGGDDDSNGPIPGTEQGGNGNTSGSGSGNTSGTGNEQGGSNTEDYSKYDELLKGYKKVAKELVNTNSAEHKSLGTATIDFLREQGVEGTALTVTNVAMVESGKTADAPTFTIKEPCVLFCVHTYHWNYSYVEGAPEVVYSYVVDGEYNKFGAEALTDWTEGSGRIKVDWWSYPCVILKPGQYQVRTNSFHTWSYNTQSDGLGFCDVYTIPLK